MSENYTAKYNVANVPVIAGLPRELATEPAARPHVRDEFIIAMAGQFYAQAEWQCLQYALNGCNWTVAGRRIRVRVMGGDSVHLLRAHPTLNILDGEARKKPSACWRIRICCTCLIGFPRNTEKSRVTVSRPNWFPISQQGGRCSAMRLPMRPLPNMLRLTTQVTSANPWTRPRSLRAWRRLSRMRRPMGDTQRMGIHAS